MPQQNKNDQKQRRYFIFKKIYISVSSRMNIVVNKTVFTRF